MRRILLTLSCISALLLSACAQEGGNQTAGTLIGAAAGAYLGHEVVGGNVGMIIGAVAGAYLGGQLGKKLDQRDRQAMENTTQQSLASSPAGTTSKWTNPDSGHAGTVTPQQQFTNKDGQECREFQQTVTVESQTQTAYGTACRQPDGTWKIVNG